MAYYDVRDGMCDKTLTPIVRGINLMCALLDGLTYNNIYNEPFWRPSAGPGPGDPSCALERIYANANRLDDELKTNPCGGPYDVDRYVKELLDDIRDILRNATAPPIRLNGLYLRNVSTTGHVENAHLLRIHDAINTMYRNTGDNMKHFCTPFMLMQTTNPVDPQDWDLFIRDCGDKTLTSLFKTETKANLGTAIQAAKAAGILVDMSKQLSCDHLQEDGKTVSLMFYSPGGGNAKKCYYNATTGTYSCIASYPYHWCNLTDTGECSAMSN